MVCVYLGVGSNIHREKHIKAGLTMLAAEFGELVVSPIYESEAVGFDGDPFLNLVVGLETDLSVGQLNTVIKRIEDQNGRDRNGPKFSSRTLDIDLLLYGETVGTVDGVRLPRDEITKNAFVLLPLADIAPKAFHPELQRTYDDLWMCYDKSQQVLRPYSL